MDKTPNSTAQTTGKTITLEDGLSEEDKKQLKIKVDELLSDVSEEIIVRTDDALSKLSNEKIMAVSELSDQILEKIKRNHEEVIFLYNMLNDKEKELKSAVKEIDSSKKKVQDIMESKAKGDGVTAVKESKPQTPIKPPTQAASIEKAVRAVPVSAASNQDIPATNGIGDNNNTKILSLYSQGKSVIEISKLLGLGQGEVKLVIDLFKNRK
jgi:hypothetical protein